ncbi:hypothetical protein POTOM_060621 [Populus tomentosa]|uniref:Retrotransposon Copia-like N-terminal domain-containing protein n=1 Tax=Populus tomentosa TaxID=118781 RepID=A0A8X7XZR0_POPTO|nr:hypothetical protein POTOM_060621 [Populus tomentosa]
MASFSTSPSFVIPNITSLVSVKLEGHNYLNWTTQFIPALKSHDLLSIVDGSEACPTQFLVDSTSKLTSDINPTYLVWQKKNQFILAWLNATLDEKVLSIVYGLTTSTQVWNALATRFAPQSRSRIIHLKRQLQTLQQGNKSCSDYLFTTKHLSDQLSAIAKLVDNEDLISYIVGRLNPNFTTFITSLSFATRDQPISFDAFQVELLNYEQLLEAQNKSQSSEITQVAFFTPKHKPTNKKPRFPTQKNHHHARSNPNPIFSAPDSKPQSTRQLKFNKSSPEAAMLSSFTALLGVTAPFQV